MALVTEARVATASGSRYLQQLCKHWSHKLAVEFTPEAGTVRFAEAVAVMTATPDTLLVRIEAQDPKVIEQMKEVVATHLNRFAFREAPLAFDWQERPVAE